MECFEKWVVAYNPGEVKLGPIVTAYLRYVYKHHGDVGGFTKLPRQGAVSKLDVYAWSLNELSERSKAIFADGFVMRLKTLDVPIYSQWMETDERCGVCLGDKSAEVRFIRHLEPDEVAKARKHKSDAPDKKVVSMKAGSLLGALFKESWPNAPEEVKTWAIEMFSNEWEASNAIAKYDLHVDKEFWRIYDPARCAGDFRSCMAKTEDRTGHWAFYANSVKAHAAYITGKEDGLVYARCVVFDDVVCVETGERYRYAERIYSNEGKLLLQHVLLNLLKAGGHVDIHKEIGVSCHDGDRIVDTKTGLDLRKLTFATPCSLIDRDNMSFQDTFKFYSPREHMAYNKRTDGAYVNTACCGAWYDYESVSNDEPDPRHRWVLDELHGRKVDTSMRPVRCSYYDREGTVFTKPALPYNDDLVLVGSDMWYVGDTIELNGRRYPRLDVVRSVVEGGMILKSEAVDIGGDYCLKVNTIKVDGKRYHKSSVVECERFKVASVAPLSTFINGEWLPVTSERVRTTDDGDVEVLCKHGGWQRLNRVEWDDDGFYDQSRYVWALFPVRDKNAEAGYALVKRRVRKEVAWYNGTSHRWYSRYHVLRSVLDKSPIVLPPRRKFRGKVNDGFTRIEDWKSAGCPLRTGVDVATWKVFINIKNNIK